MAITFSKRPDGSAWGEFAASQETGSLDSIAAPIVGRLFSQTAAPRAGDTVVFEKNEAQTIRIQGQDMPRWLREEGQRPAPVTHYFACSKGTAAYLVTALNQDDSITVQRGDT